MGTATVVAIDMFRRLLDFEACLLAASERTDLHPNIRDALSKALTASYESDHWPRLYDALFSSLEHSAESRREKLNG